jgi:3-oxoacyl-[acyl-carrier protein] reductase
VDVSGQLDGKVALITGSGRNIGRAIALRFADEGADVVVNSRRNQAEADEVAEQVRSRGRRAIVVLADVGEPAEVEALVAAAFAAFGRVDVLVNAAAIRPHVAFTELTQEEWAAVRSVVLDGALRCTQAVISKMVAGGGGSVLFVAGEGAWAGGAERAHVSATKMALVGLCRGLATEFGPRGVRCNVLSPGRIDTVRSVSSAPPADVSEIPLGRLGTVDDIASAALFLVSDHAAWITGQTLHVNGGHHYH